MVGWMDGYKNQINGRIERKQIDGWWLVDRKKGCLGGYKNRWMVGWIENGWNGRKKWMDGWIKQIDGWL